MGKLTFALTKPLSKAAALTTPLGALRLLNGFILSSLGAIPGAPTIGVVTAAGSTSVSVAFTPPASDGGSVITSYTVTSSPGGFTGTGASSPIVVSGLTWNTSYTFTVTATNAVGTGPASAASSAITPDTAPFSAVSILLHGDGSNGGTVFTDSSSFNATNDTTYTNNNGNFRATPVSGATTNTAVKKFGTASFKFTNATDCVLFPSATQMAMGTGDCTIEFWMNYQTAAGATDGGIINCAAAQDPIISCGTTGIGGTLHKLNWYDGGGTKSSTTSVDDGTWHFIALVRSGNNHYIYVDGTRETTSTHAAANYLSSGTHQYGNGYHPVPASSYIDDLRITKGYARYTGATMTVPTAAFPNS